jgi:hypothetical protein
MHVVSFVRLGSAREHQEHAQKQIFSVLKKKSVLKNSGSYSELKFE